VSDQPAPALPRPTGLRWYWLLGAVAVLVAATIVGLVVGAVDLAPQRVLAALLDRLPLVAVDSGLTPVQESVLFELRLPRVLIAAVVGGALALAGASYQGVFRNPLADPYLLGAAAGAGLGATIVLVYAPGMTVGGAGVVPAAAFAGAICGVGLAYGLGATTGRSGGTATLLLAGIAVASFLTAVQTFVLQSRTEALQRVYSWILGQLGAASWSDLGLVLPYVLISTGTLLLHGRLLDVLAVGDDEAASLGIRAQRVRLTVLVAASLATASAVAVSGLIGFVGIVVPHIVRRLTAGSYRVVLPLSLLGGAAFLVLADVVARTAIAPAELPIGVVTAFVGAPFFAALLWISRRTIA
jgi:iron complex transport system permease protein